MQNNLAHRSQGANMTNLEYYSGLQLYGAINILTKNTTTSNIPSNIDWLVSNMSYTNECHDRDVCIQG